MRTKAFVTSAAQILLLIVTVEHSLAACPEFYVPIGTRCYYFVPREGVTWYQAYFMCIFNYKGYLVEIQDQEEQNLIRNYLQTVIDPAGKYSFWIGASDLLLENDYRWMSSGNRVSFRAWDPRTNEPNNQFGIENCAMIYKGRDYLWSDIGCTNIGNIVTPPLRAICEVAPK